MTIDLILCKFQKYSKGDSFAFEVTLLWVLRANVVILLHDQSVDISFSVGALWFDFTFQVSIWRLPWR